MKQDTRVKLLIKKVEERRAEIKNCKRPNYKTNMQYGSLNINVVNDRDKILEVYADILKRFEFIEKAHEVLECEPLGEPKVCGWTYAEWYHDFKIKLRNIITQQKQKELNKLEASLEALKSDELKRELALDALESALGGD